MKFRAQDFREEFFDQEGRIYLNCAGQAPLPRAAVRAILEALEWQKFPERLTHELYADLPDQTRALLAELIGADPHEIAITNGASDGVNAVARGLDWRPGDEIVLPAGEFPANYYPWKWLERRGVRIVEVQPSTRFVSVEDLLAALGPRTRLLALSWVNYSSALRLDLARLAEACREGGVHLFVDGSQAVGAIPFDVKQLGVSFLAVAGYKWLLGPYGTGFFYVREDLTEQLEVNRIYWQALEGAFDFSRLPRDGAKLRPGARRWDASETASFANLAGLRASVEFLLRVGVERIEQHTRELVCHLVEHLPRDRCVLASPAEDSQRGTFVCVAARTPEATQGLWQKLQERKIFVALRENALRIAPHLYNSAREIDQLLDVLGE